MQDSKRIELLNEALEDEQFAAAVGEAATEAEFAAMLADKGIELADDEAAECFEAVKKGVSDDGELGEESLDDVSGGILWPITGPIIAWYIIRKLRRK